MSDYNPEALEKKWQSYWLKNRTFEVTRDAGKPKYYILDMFPYPSGDGLHVGHPEGYTATDILARYKRMRGFNVLHPMGWDAFGLPAERFAMKTGTHPAVRTEECIKKFKAQIQRLGFSYDWSREINTTDPHYYKWTQWIFKKLYEKGLAYISEEPVWWSDHFKTVLANEEVVDGQYEGHPVRRMKLRQWVLKITEYAERLLNDLELVEWPPSTKEMQKNWIGKSEGARVGFGVYSNEARDNLLQSIDVFTTRPDTLFGATFMVLAPEHPILDHALIPSERRVEIDAYRHQVAKKSDLARTDLSKEKTGINTGLFALNPVNGRMIPVWTADYVLMSYGTGAIMAVPGHDARDFEFAQSFGIPLLRVVAESKETAQDPLEEPYEDSQSGMMVNSDFLNGMEPSHAKETIIQWLEKNQKGKREIQYKLRDWLFSRQRYWGEPFPIIHWNDGTISLVDDKSLPVTLPETQSYEPSDTGESPLANMANWVQVSQNGKTGRRETNTMPQWAGSCWYYLRYLDPKNHEAAWSSADEKYWMPVDLYVGGAEHAVLHLLYARFWHKVLFDLGFVSTPEPFKKLVHQGMILGSDGEKMSKSRGNVVNPDDVVNEYGADAFRLYEMFMGPLERSKPWNTKGLEGTFRFLKRAYRWVSDVTVTDLEENAWDPGARKAIHRLIEGVTDDLESLQFNTAIAKMMEFLNEAHSWTTCPRGILERFTIVLAPFAPHLGEEFWEKLGHKSTITFESWPQANAALLVESQVEMGVQINGKIRGKVMIAKDASEEDAVWAAFGVEGIQKYIGKRENIRKVIYKPGRILNLIVPE